MRPRAVLLLALVPAILSTVAQSAETRNVPVVTQIQGATFYRTSITLTNGNETITTPIVMEFSYRSPADGSFQIATLTVSPSLGPKQVRFFDDIIQEFKNAGAIRPADAELGTLRDAARDVRRAGHPGRGRRRREDVQPGDGRRDAGIRLPRAVASARSGRDSGRSWRGTERRVSATTATRGPTSASSTRGRAGAGRPTCGSRTTTGRAGCSSSSSF